MHVPESLSDAEAAGLPRFGSSRRFSICSSLAEVKFGDTVLVHGGGSGVGTASILLLKRKAAREIDP